MDVRRVGRAAGRLYLCRAPGQAIRLGLRQGRQPLRPCGTRRGNVRNVQHCRSVLPCAFVRPGRCDSRVDVCPRWALDAGSVQRGNRRAGAGCLRRRFAYPVRPPAPLGLARSLVSRAARGFDRAGAGRRRVLARIQSGVHLFPVLTMNRQWLHAWVAALLVCVLLAVGYEWLLRQRGYLVTVQDDADLWSMQLDRIRNSPRAVALLGASRIEFGIDPQLLSHELGGRPVAMLAVNGRYPLAALRELADDPSFVG